MAERLRVFDGDPDGFDRWLELHRVVGFYFVERARLVHRVGLCNHIGNSASPVYTATSIEILQRRGAAEGFVSPTAVTARRED